MYRANDGKFWIRVTREEFKNRRFLEEDEDYITELADWAQGYFAHYVDHVLPKVGTDENGVQWLITDIHGHRINKHRLSELFSAVFQTYFDLPIGPHAARHLWVTDFLNSHPGEYLVAAFILNDRIETVLREYGHIRIQHQLAKFNSYASVEAAAARKDLMLAA